MFKLDELYFNILVTAEIAFSVGLIFSGDLDSGALITSTNLGNASAQNALKNKFYIYNIYFTL